jgi:membrane protein
MLALFPAILAILTALSLFEESIQSTITDVARQYKDVVPDLAWQLLKNFVAEISHTKSKSLFSLSFVVAIWVASGALGAAMNALDRIHQIPPEQRRPFWKAKLISVFITFSTILLLILASFLVLLGDSIVKLAVNTIVLLPVERTGVSLLLTLWQILSWPIAFAVVVTTVYSIYQIYQLPADRKQPLQKLKLLVFVIVIVAIISLLIASVLVFINHIIVTLEFDYSMAAILIGFWRLLSWPVALAIVAVAFAFIYRIGPSRWVKGTPILPGAILAAVSWAILSGLFRLYVSNFGNYNKVYGAVGAVIVLLLWLQMTAFVMLLGDQLNATVGEEIKVRKKKKLVATIKN